MIKTTHALTSLALLSLTTAIQPAARVAAKVLAAKGSVRLSTTVRFLQPMPHPTHLGRSPVKLHVSTGMTHHWSRPFSTSSNQQPIVLRISDWRNGTCWISDAIIHFDVDTPRTEAAMLTELMSIAKTKKGDAKRKLSLLKELKEREPKKSYYYRFESGYDHWIAIAKAEHNKWIDKEILYENELKKLNGTQGKLINLRTVSLL